MTDKLEPVLNASGKKKHGKMEMMPLRVVQFGLNKIHFISVCNHALTTQQLGCATSKHCCLYIHISVRP